MRGEDAGVAWPECPLSPEEMAALTIRDFFTGHIRPRTAAWSAIWPDREEV